MSPMESSSTRFPGQALPAAYLTPGSSSFTDFLRVAAPELMPGSRPVPDGAVEAPHGTTIVALTFRGGVLLAGDRRATMGNLIAQRDMEKLYVTDDYSAVGIAGTAGIALEMVRLYAIELEHYEKLEGVSLSLDGKANKLATMLRGNLQGAMAGLAVLPLFAGFDVDADDPDRAGRIVSYDITGGRYNELGGYYAVGSGSLFAKSALKKRFDPDADVDTAVRAAVEALYDAADDDTATGGPDLSRRIYPSIITITGTDGATRVPEERAAEIATEVVNGRMQNPGG
ncbi:proteasome beta subunit [Saccharopolyspora erythraea NRRL 2338]|uniref:Proteasome subunit beta n=2 Tax=Saccharopolyspora erythraea TaxID=1836 RepID=PSB_SACEN|nr:RecName: Full=Proteasome subunit beta; AltName: Full=20S proteasome beta subunit; AltName: Full=Proteasome core protein PrcB; Flags: Precursor [Saccharopolyspora erythraea NRRL 2338]EQD84089.1 proteasome subunit beta [Saccharopolyspora erythraea D]PFG95328.1 proteasome beta subunit [Saccharopolyspora erythraea NRRL 2338]CAM01556.1 20S proteasome beta-subunit precursor [Saccharopolyspora erythraea NRRL 2338]